MIINVYGFYSNLLKVNVDTATDTCTATSDNFILNINMGQNSWRFKNTIWCLAGIIGSSRAGNHHFSHRSREGCDAVALSEKYGTPKIQGFEV